MNKGSIKQRCFKAVTALCWTPVTPTGKPRGSQTFLENAAALIYAAALRITNNFLAAQAMNLPTIRC